VIHTPLDVLAFGLALVAILIPLLIAVAVLVSLILSNARRERAALQTGISVRQVSERLYPRKPTVARLRAKR
jgi:hypothetical protein